MRRSKDILEGILGVPVDSISYPFGRCNPWVLEAAQESGYRNGFTMSFPNGEDGPLARGRMAVYAYDTLLSIEHKLGGGPANHLERLKAGITNRLALGTVFLNRLRGLN